MISRGFGVRVGWPSYCNKQADFFLGHCSTTKELEMVVEIWNIYIYI